MKMIFAIILVTLFLFWLMIYAAFYGLLKGQFKEKHKYDELKNALRITSNHGL